MDGHILITGGSGFLGSNICKMAASMNIPVVAISRSGRPLNFPSSLDSMVTFVKADVFEPSSWISYLKGCRAVIHCVAILKQYPEKGITHDKFIYQSARVVGEESLKAGISKFVLISAAKAPGIFLQSYSKAKQDAENYITSVGLEYAILRPGLIVGKERPFSVKTGAMMRFSLRIPLFNRVVNPLRPLPAKIVAKAALVAAINSSINGVLSINDIELIGNNNRNRSVAMQPLDKFHSYFFKEFFF
jgi:uncharacterized protein YbjT (DUF2867 family)